MDIYMEQLNSVTVASSAIKVCISLMRDKIRTYVFVMCQKLIDVVLGSRVLCIFNCWSLFCSYCECFAAGAYCVEPCSCQDCFNKPIHEDTVLETRKQIESRNPLAFAPKVIQTTDFVAETVVSYNLQLGILQLNFTCLLFCENGWQTKSSSWALTISDVPTLHEKAMHPPLVLCFESQCRTVFHFLCIYKKNCSRNSSLIFSVLYKQYWGRLGLANQINQCSPPTLKVKILRL